MRRRWRSVAFLAAVIAAWVLIEVYGFNAPITRTADGRGIVVRDGDTMTVGDGDVRLDGIDAVEYGQICKGADGKDWACGKAARTALADLVKGRTVTCEERARDEYARIVALCRDETSRDLAAAIATQGFAISPGRFGDGPYAAEVGAAKSAKRGIWGGTFHLPDDWRARHPRARPAPAS
jgi:endonuclease YncB( thermonuclease family)